MFRFKNFFVAIIFSAVCVFNFTAQAAMAAPEILADAAILIEPSTGRVIFEKNADSFFPPASMTKMMTCILGIEYLSPFSEIEVSPEAAAVEYSDLNLQAGDKISASDLLLGTMLVSDNAGAVVVAQAVGGNISNFVKMMNDKAKEIGCTNTNFENPNGLPINNHYSTARDMAKIASYCMKNSEFRNYVGTVFANIHVISPERTFDALTTNKLLETYEGATGIKTGYTMSAGGCVAASAKRGEVELIAVVMHSTNMDTRFDDAAKLLDYGFENVESIRKIEVGKIKQVVFVRGGKSGTVHVETTEDLNFPLLKDESENLLTVTYDLPKFIDAEIERGKIIGSAILNYDGKPVATVPLAAIENVAKGFSFSSWLVELSESFRPAAQDFLLKFVA